MPSRAARDTGREPEGGSAFSVSSLLATGTGTGDMASVAGSGLGVRGLSGASDDSRGSGVEVRGPSRPRSTAEMRTAGGARRVGALSNFRRVERTTSGGGRSVSRNNGVGRRGGRAVRGCAGGRGARGGGGEGDGARGSSRESRRLNASTERARFTESRRVEGIKGAGGTAMDAGRGGRKLLRGAGAGGGRSSNKCSREVARRNTEGRRRGASRSAKLR